MSGPAIAMMIVICGLVWGGFVSCILFVKRKEREKKARRDKFS
ncbi:MAG: MetS family NSS transporter small subunit [Candidatus Krumholzibacteria bacterium]|nr:MetS family NSS transporter small subunit [Candidatus Krumholzibacteria bacterium]